MHVGVPAEKPMYVKDHETLAITRCTKFWLYTGRNRVDQQETGLLPPAELVLVPQQPPTAVMNRSKYHDT